MKKIRIKLTDPRKPIGFVQIAEHKRKVFPPITHEERLLKQVAHALNHYSADEIIKATQKVNKWSELKRRMMARFGVLITADKREEQ